jgi:hypothetical protein
MVCCLSSLLTPEVPSVWRSSSGSGKKAFPAKYPQGRVNGWCSIGLEQEQEKTRLVAGKHVHKVPFVLYVLHLKGSNLDVQTAPRSAVA